ILHIDWNLHLDPVVAKLPFSGSAWPLLSLVVIYLLVVLRFGRRYMDKRRPYNIQNIIIVYNIFQVIYNVILFFTMCKYMKFYTRTYNVTCMPTLPMDHPEKNIERMLSYAFYINKISDMLDTFFFVLRKSYKQITVLHVYHHILMATGPYWVFRFYGVGGQYSSMILLNTFVHLVMYFYYLMSALNPAATRNLWWKKYITILQFVQFSIAMLQSVYIVMFNPSCEYPIIFHYITITGGLIFVAMFTNFYIQSYLKPRHKKQ
ncbi:hypothetical protein KR093_000211, partial [Drosophila rubida]